MCLCTYTLIVFTDSFFSKISTNQIALTKNWSHNRENREILNSFFVKAQYVISLKPEEISRKSIKMKNAPLEIISIHSDTHSVELRNYYFQD